MKFHFWLHCKLSSECVTDLTFDCIANRVKAKDTNAVAPTAHRTASASKYLQTEISNRYAVGKAPHGIMSN